jgi:hypothetical protein
MTLPLRRARGVVITDQSLQKPLFLKLRLTEVTNFRLYIGQSYKLRPAFLRMKQPCFGGVGGGQEIYLIIFENQINVRILPLPPPKGDLK